MGGFSIWHWLITLVFLVGVPALVIWVIVRATRSKAPGRPESSTGDRLEELARLRDKGLVSAEEYEAKRLELLGNL